MSTVAASASKTVVSVAPRLVLHFDVNETILCCDPAGGDTFEDTLNKMIAKNALVRMDTENDQVVWYDGTTPSLSGPSPPLNCSWVRPEGTTSYYQKYRGQGSSFTEEGPPGQCYRHIYDELEKKMRWPKEHLDASQKNPLLHEDGAHHFLLPALFRTLHELVGVRKRNVSLVIRTFGTDIDEVVGALNAYGAGHHLKEYGSLPACTISPDRVWIGRYDNTGSFTLTQKGGSEKCVIDENEVLNILQGSAEESLCVVACQDDYQWWRDHNFSPGAGKPLWLTEKDALHHHIFFDDNIKNDPNDSIVAVRARTDASQTFQPLTGEETIALHGMHLVRVPTFKPILDETWFLKQIEACEKKFQEIHKESVE